MATKGSAETEADGVQILQNEDTFVPELNFIDRIGLQNGVPDIQHCPSTLRVDIASSSHSWIDYQGYFTTFTQEMDFIAKIEGLADKGLELIHMLYTYRSVSQAIPELSLTTPKEATAEEAAEIASKRAEVNRKVLEVLRPEIGKLKDFMAYVIQAVMLIHGCFTHLTAKEARKEQVPEGIHLSLMRLMDVLIILDNLKDIKTCLQKDFSRYKRVVGANPSIEVLEELTQLQQFLSNPDPRKSKNYVFTSIRDEVKRVTGHETILVDTMDLATETLDRGFFVTPEEQFRLIRVLPYYMLIVDGEPDDAKSFNIFKTNKIKTSSLQKVFKKHPVVPLYGDMTIALELVLHRSAHYDKVSMSGAWGRDADSRVAQQYTLAAHWEGIRLAHSNYLARFAAAVNRQRKHPMKKTLDASMLGTAQDMFDLVVEGMQKLSSWTAVVKKVLSWKYTHPCSVQQLVEQKIDATADGIEYGRVLRYNLSQAELSQLVDLISIIKSLAATIQKCESLLAPYLRFHIHHCIQQLVQYDLIPLLHRVEKRKKPIFPTLLKLRALGADWLNGKEPHNDYKEYSRKHGQKDLVHPPRVVSASATQLYILRAQVGSLCDSNSEVRAKKGLFSKADLEKEDVAIFEHFYESSFFFAPVLDFARTLKEVSDLGDLWFREYYLEMTKCIQFPIEMSLPWILTEHVIMNHVSNTPMVENVLFMLDIYNDAAQRALYELNQQYLYDEIEAEANLVIDQLYFLLSDEVYTHYKDLAAVTVIEQSLKNKLEALKHDEHLTVNAKRLESLLAQRHIQLLGRSINFSFILGQNINNKFYRDIDFGIKRFESSDARAITELKTFLDLLRNTHARLSGHLQLDNFDNMLHEMNESFVPTLCRGRISLHMLNSLARDIIPNSSYNYHTGRFVSSPIAFRLMDCTKAPKQAKVVQAYGSVGAKVLELCGRLTRGFFGRPHLEAYLSLGGRVSDLAMVIDQCVKNMYDKIVDISEYLEALKDGIPPCKPPKFMFKTVGGYGFYEGKLRSILSYDDLKPEVFQNFREIGNTIALLRDLSDLLELSDQFDFMLVAPLLGSTPMSATTGATGAGAENGRDDDSSSSSTSSSNHKTSSSPLVRVVNHVAKEVAVSPELQAHTVRAVDAWSQLPAMVQRVAENTYHAVCYGESSNSSSSSGSGGCGRSLIKWVLLRIEEFLYQRNLTVEWAVGAPGNGTSHNSSISNIPGDFSAVEVENATGFHRLWSALSFLFCIVDTDDDSASPEAAGGDASQVTDEQLISNEAEFGHGFTIAGCLFLHLLGQRSMFELLDFSNHVLRMHFHEEKMREFDATQAQAALDSSLLQETQGFLDAAKSQQLLQSEILAFFETLHKSKDSYTKTAIEKIVFHPPADA